MKKIIIVLVIVMIFFCGCGKKKVTDEKLIKKYFGVTEENYTIISAENELSKDDYAGRYIVKINVEYDKMGSFLKQIDKAGYYSYNEDGKESFISDIQKMSEDVIDINDPLYNYVGPVKRKVPAVTQPKTVYGYITYPNSSKDSCEILMIYMES